MTTIASSVNPILPPDPHNLRLAANVHPSSWQNPRPAPRYNMVVLGAGTAGLVISAGAAGLGAKVALVERNFMGGDCLNYGCVPSKAIIRPARIVGEIHRARSMGISARLERIDFGAVMERMRGIRADLSAHDSAARFTELGVDVFFGDGHFASPETIEVGTSVLRFRRAAIAAGGRAAALPLEGLEAAGYLTNESIFSLTELPRRLAVVGGGAIGCELAQAFARLGAEVTIVEALPRILSREDHDAAEIVNRSLIRDGVKIVTGAAIARVERRGSDKVLHIASSDADGRPAVAEEIIADEILLSVGRTPNLDGLNLAAARIAYSRNGVIVDDHLRTTNRRVYAAGDVCTGGDGTKSTAASSVFDKKFTHMADAMARIVIRNALFHGRAQASALIVPSCVYTDPEIGQVGLTEEQARARGDESRTFTRQFADVDRASIDGEIEGFAKLHVVRDKIVGATLVGSHAGEMISEITVAIGAGLGMGKLAEVIHPYPTQAEVFRQAADAFNRTRLTPRLKRLFTRWFALTR
ncbi:MAG TPA: mercuric reductase [Candidatus Binataceae bacterium]|nr:mercuric reductase [Candidatus Binataceae bacterium]